MDTFTVARDMWSAIVVPLFDAKYLVPLSILYLMVVLFEEQKKKGNEEDNEKSKGQSDNENEDDDDEWGREPMSPEIMRQFKSWKTIGKSVRIALGNVSVCHVQPEYLVRIQHFINERFGETVALPLNTIAVSIASRNFQVGDTLHEFLPVDEETKTPTFSTFDQYTDNLQLTYWHTSEDEYSFAGVCLYMPGPSSAASDPKLEMEKIKEVFETNDDKLEAAEFEDVSTGDESDKDQVDKEFDFGME